MQLPPDFGASKRPLNDEDIQKLVELDALKGASSQAGASDSWDELESAPAGSKQTTPPGPQIPTSLGFKESPPAVVPENIERARLLSLIEQSKLNSDKELADAKKVQTDKDNMAAILGGVNLFSSGMASQNTGSKIDVDGSFNEKLVTDGKAGVEGAKSSRESKLKDLLGNYDRLREDMADRRNAASDQRLLNNDKFDRIYKQKQLDISSANAAANRAIASEARNANLDIRKQSLKIKQDNEKEKDDTLQIPGYDRVSGRITPQEAKEARGAIASVGELRDLLTQYKDAIKKEGTFELFGDGSERLKKLTKGIQRAMGRANEFGVIQAGELPMLEQMSTYDPESTRALFTKNSTAAAGIDQIMDNLDHKMSNKVESIGYAPKAGSASNTEKVKVIDSNGRVGTIPKANLEKALAKGYKVAE